MTLNRFMIFTGNRWGNFNAISNVVNTEITPNQIIEGKPIELEFIFDNTLAYSYMATSSSDFSNIWGIYSEYSTNKRIHFYYGSSFLSLYIDSTLFVNGNIYTAQVSVIGLNYNFKVFDSDGVQQGTTQVVAIPGTLPTDNIHVGVFRYGGSMFAYSPSKQSKFTANNETFPFFQTQGSVLYGSLGTELTLAGDLSNFWQGDGITYIPSTRFKVKPFLDKVKVAVHISPVNFVKDAIYLSRYDYYKIRIYNLTLDDWKDTFEQLKQMTVYFNPFLDIYPGQFFKVFVEKNEHNYRKNRYDQDIIDLMLRRTVYRH